MKDVKVLNRKGFTLIELLAVIIILAVLMMLAGNSVITIMANTRRSAFRTEFLSLLEFFENLSNIYVFLYKKKIRNVINKVNTIMTVILIIRFFLGLIVLNIISTFLYIYVIIFTDSIQES